MSPPMKKTIRNISGAALLGLMLITANSTLVAQTSVQSTTSTTTNAAGTISTFSPDAIAIRTTTTSDPVSYSYTKTTTYVDENGNPVSMALVKSGLPVTVYYTIDGEKMVASKVIVRKSSTTTTTDK